MIPPASKNRKITLAIVFGALLLAGVGITLKVRAARSFSDPHELLSRFPAEEAIVLDIDLAAVRKGGFLPSPKSAPEAEYKQFLDATGFDYRRDLDSVVASFSKSGNFYIARGRFDWKKLRDYAARQGGSCYQDLCRMPGSTPVRRISFLPLRDDVIALAVSTDDLAANRLTKPGDRISAEIPAAPAWLSIPGTALRDSAVLPAGFRLMLSAMTNTDRIVITVVPAGSGLVAKLDATCRTSNDAGVLTSQLHTLAARLKETGTSDDTARLLASGTFEENGIHVTGQWPLSKTLLATLTDGI